jgi:mRNA interferase MazF
MTGFDFGEVVLVPFPFTDQTASKQRPAVVVSSAAYNRERADLIILALTSRVRRPLGFGEAAVEGWREAGLPKPSVMKPVLATLEQGLVRKRLGRLAPSDTAAPRELLVRITTS